MTGLNDKSAELIELLTATNAKLDSVVTALGALAPADPLDISGLVSVLGDIHTDTMSMDGKLLTIKDDLHQTYTGVYIGHEIMTSILLAMIPGESPVMQPIATMLDDIRRNELSLMGQIVTAIVMTACECDPVVPQLPVPPSTVPYTGTDLEKCKRVQKVLVMFTGVVDAISAVGASSAGVSAFALRAILTEAALAGGLIGAEAGAIAGPPGVVVGGIIFAIAGAIAALGAAAMSTLGSQWNTPPLITNIQNGLYSASNSAEGMQAFADALVADADLWDLWEGLLFLLWYAAWSDLIYSNEVVLDTTGFDGSICISAGGGGGGGWGDCVDVTSIATVQTDPNGSTHNVYDADLSQLGYSPVTTMVYSGGTIGFSNAVVAVADFNGVSFQVVSGTGVRVVWTNANGGTIAAHDLIPGDPPWTLTETTYALLLDDAAGGSTHGAFTVSICPA